MTIKMSNYYYTTWFLAGQAFLTKKIPFLELPVELKPESQGDRAGQDDLHALSGIDV